MVAVLLGCGLRRAELAAAQVQDVQQREEHWVFADPIGKGGHIRTVPIPDWVDFPHPPGSNAVAPGLVARINMLITLFAGHMDQWARVYDHDGIWRYAINILHASPDVPGGADAQFAEAFETSPASFESRSASR